MPPQQTQKAGSNRPPAQATISAQTLADLAGRAIRIQEAIEDGDPAFAFTIARQLEDELLTLRDAA
jgi:hypothetical protein